ncbi:MAG TPA: acetoacetate decarboxylase family protein [Ktedonobacterales bacterium]
MSSGPADVAWGDAPCDLPGAPYPPAPWIARSQFWAGLFHATQPVVLPQGLRPLLGSHTRALMLVRYLRGSTLQYDELILAAPVWLGRRPGLYIDHIWVNNLASAWGGRRIWGLPKRLAEFDWTPANASVADSQGIILRVALNRQPVRGPRFPLATASVGRLGERWTWSVFTMRARLGRPGMQVLEMSDRFGFQLATRPVFSLASRDCAVIFAAPALLGGSGDID